MRGKMNFFNFRALNQFSRRVHIFGYQKHNPVLKYSEASNFVNRGNAAMASKTYGNDQKSYLFENLRDKFCESVILVV